MIFYRQRFWSYNLKTSGHVDTDVQPYNLKDLNTVHLLSSSIYWCVAGVSVNNSHQHLQEKLDKVQIEGTFLLSGGALPTILPCGFLLLVQFIFHDAHIPFPPPNNSVDVWFA